MLKKLLTSLLNWFNSIIEKIQDITNNKLSTKITGKITTPENSKKIAMAAIICFVAAYVIVSLSESEYYVGSGITKLTKEKKVKFGVSELEQLNKIEIGDPLEELKEEEVDENTKCELLVERVKNGEVLSSFEYELFEVCLKSANFSDLSIEQKKALKMLANPDSDLTDKERKILRDFAGGDDTNADIANGLMSSNPNVRKAAKILANNPNLSKDEIEALKKVMDGTITDPNLINSLLSDDPELRKKAAAYIKNKDEKLLKEIKDQLNNNSIKGGLEGDTDELDTKQKIKLASELKERIKNRALEIAEVQGRVNSLREKLKKSGVFQKVANGEELTEEEQKLYDEFLSESQKLAKLKRDQARDIQLYKKLSQEIQSSLGELGFSGVIEDGFIERYAKDIPGKTSNSEKQTEIFDIDGNTIPYSMYKLIQEKKQALRDFDNFEGSLATNLPASSLKETKIAISSLQVWSRNPLDSANLSPTLRIPVTLETKILVSDKSPEGKRVVLRFNDHVIDPESNEVLIPLGAKIVGKTGKFDENTKLIDITDLNSVYLNGNKINVAFDVMTANGYSGIPGGVKSTRKEKLTAAVLSQFAASMTEYFSLVVADQTDSNDSLDPVTALTAGGLDGASKGFEKMSELLVQDFQNAASIFYAPKGMKLILTPKP